eukprot:Hpha_TRINITY_DN31088_c0_g1::TRINITY_DN31088_c0_g1_i1::g.63920::m.63920
MDTKPTHRYVVGVDWVGQRRNNEVLVRGHPTIDAVRKEAERIFTIDAKCEKAAPWHSSEGLNLKVTSMKIWDSVLESWTDLLYDFQLRERTQIWCLSASTPYPPDIDDIPRTRSGFSQAAQPPPGAPFASGWRDPGSPWRYRHQRSSLQGLGAGSPVAAILASSAHRASLTSPRSAGVRAECSPPPTGLSSANAPLPPSHSPAIPGGLQQLPRRVRGAPRAAGTRPPAATPPAVVVSSPDPATVPPPEAEEERQEAAVEAPVVPTLPEPQETEALEEVFPPTEAAERDGEGRGQGQTEDQTEDSGGGSGVVWAPPLPGSPEAAEREESPPKGTEWAPPPPEGGEGSAKDPLWTTPVEEPTPEPPADVPPVDSLAEDPTTGPPADDPPADTPAEAPPDPPPPSAEEGPQDN